MNKFSRVVSIISISALLTITAISVQTFAAGGGGGGSPAPDPTPAPAPAPAPAPTPLPAPVCMQDTWSCGDWGQCRKDGTQTRTCTMTNDCAGVQTPSPSQAQACPGLKCAQLGTLAERAKCRLGLTTDELAQEYKILYYPEYCKNESSEEEGQKCIDLYRSFNPCWQLPIGPEREKCAKKVIKFKPIIKAQAICMKKQGNLRKTCFALLHDKREKLALFQMYEYEFQAEDLMSKGKATLDDTANFDVFVETTKQKIDVVKTPARWAKLLDEVKKKWEGFRKGK